MRAKVIVVMAMLVAGCGSQPGGGIAVSDARLGEPTGPNAALYLTLTASSPDRLVGASSDAGAAVELHETVVDDDGTVSMRPVDSFEVTPDEPLVLEPGGRHAMLIDADRMEPGETVEVVLEFDTAGALRVTADVVEPQHVLTDAGDHDGP